MATALRRGCVAGLCALVALALVGAAGRIVGTQGPDVLGGTPGRDYLDGLGGRDDIKGEAGEDTLVGGPGADTLDGGSGNDTYLFRRGDGQDRISNGDNTPGRKDSIRFAAGIFPGDVTLTRTPANALVVQYGRGDRITVLRHFEADGTGPFRIDEIRFANGRTWDAEQIRRKVLEPGEGNQYLVGYGGADRIQGRGGNDQIYGGGGDDILDGGSGNDRLYGDDNSDTLIGGPGDDVLRGEMGSDTYIYRAGDGMDTILNFSAPGDVDVIRFVNIAKPQVRISTRSNDLLLIVGTDAKGRPQGIKVAGFNASNAHPIDRIEYARGTPTTAQELLALFPTNAARTRTAPRVPAGTPPQPAAPTNMAPTPGSARTVRTPLDAYSSEPNQEGQ